MPEASLLNCCQALLLSFLCCAVWCCAVLCCVVLRCAVLCGAAWCCVVLCGALLCFAVWCTALLCGAVLCCAVQCNTMQCCAERCCAFLSGAVSMAACLESFDTHNRLVSICTHSILHDRLLLCTPCCLCCLRHAIICCAHLHHVTGSELIINQLHRGQINLACVLRSAAGGTHILAFTACLCDCMCARKVWQVVQTYSRSSHVHMIKCVCKSALPTCRSELCCCLCRLSLISSYLVASPSG